MREYNERLKNVVSELLARADESDQQSKYAGVQSEQWSQQLRNACTALVKLGDELPTIDRFLAEENVKAARETILDCCKTAAGIAVRLDSIRLTIRQPSDS